ncbi:MAG TPA: hypothetical protein VGO14_03265 [Solirubrobacteraceae bacterium]|jgi:hypothetical protein|nr:hypothetical protein [Solirubrobacteraceae bacterium]
MSVRRPRGGVACWALAIVFALALLLPGAGAGAASTAALPGAAGCPVAADPSALPDAATLREMNSVVAALRVRPTGSGAQNTYIKWILRQLAKVPGASVSEQHFTINRWSHGSMELRLKVGEQTTAIPIAAPVPYAEATPGGGASASLVRIPDEEKITAANAAGRIVVRPAPAGNVPYYDFFLPVVSWAVYDPQNTIDPTQSFFGDFINYNARVADLRDAAAAGARGVLFVKELPRAQLTDHYEPYEGTPWHVPAVYLGADEGKQISDAMASGAPVSARLVVHAGYRQVDTPTVRALIAGQSPQRIVVDSHTDGTNAVEDNGPVAMVAMARYLARLPVPCRPRSVEFVFPTAHFYQRLVDPSHRHGGAGVVATQLDGEYDQGLVSSVLVLEHLGAIDYEQMPRADGGPGQELLSNGLRAIQFIGVTPSPPLVATVTEVVRRYDMQRTILLQGADAPGATVPSHCNFGGEGTPYNQHLLPTIGVISAPQSLYDPSFGLEGIDFNVMHDELLGYTELLNRLGTMAQAEVAGEIPLERQQRAQGAAPCPPEN